MKSLPKLIILNGFSASGKSTIAKKYVENHPLSLNIEGDEIIAMIGEWKNHYDEARKCVFPHTKAMIDTHLGLGYDVVVPYLLVNAKEVEEFEKIARKHDARFFEIMLYAEKKDAINKLLKRGKWGEDGLPKISKEELPHIEDLYDRMERATAKRKNTLTLEIEEGDVEGTYEQLLKLLK